MWRFLPGLQREEAFQQTLLLQMLAGAPAPPQERKYRDLNTRLRNNIQRFENEEMELMEFLRGISYNITLDND